MINIPDDCILVKLVEGVCGFTLFTWHIQPGEVKTIPLDIYEACEGRVEVVSEEDDLLLEDETVETDKPITKKVVKNGKSKRKKHRSNN